MAKKKELSNPFSTGGGGVHFEAHVQASFVALMLTGGHAPCLPCWPIVEIKLQGKIDDYDTDDLIVIVENVTSKERRKLLGQVKHSIAITQGSTIFGEVIQAAWNDFNNPNVFSKNKDIIALITGPLAQTDTEVVWILNHARSNQSDPERFFRNIATAKFSSNVKRQKLNVIRDHLKVANNGIELTDDVFHKFLTHFYLLGYDLGEEEGVVISLINSHISQFKPESSRLVWSRILEFSNNRNHHAGCITKNDFPDELTSVFVAKPISEMPSNFALPHEHSTDWSHHPDATYLALAVLIGSWQDKSQSDLEMITQLLDISYDEWLKKARELLHLPDSPLSLKNGIWKVVNRAELWNLLGSRILDQNLDTFRLLAVERLKEPDPAFELSVEERYMASIQGKVLKCSQVLRKGIADGLAILGSRPELCINCSHGKAETTCILVVRELLTDANWVLWGSLNSLLPTLAEAAPSEFLDAVEKAMPLIPCPFDELFSQEGSGFTGGNYLTGLLWALEGLAWDEQYLVRVCVALGELASHDPGGQWANRPSNSLTTILLPWLPQTLAPVDKRKVAVRTLLQEWPDIAWSLIIRLLPGQHQTSSGSHKPSWRKIIPEDWEKGVTHQEYWQQASFYAELAVAAADHDTARLSTLIDHFDNLPGTAFDELLQTLASQPILKLPEEQRLSIWDHLTKFTNKHRRFSEAKWALPDELITRIEQVAEQLAPNNPFNLYQHLFTDRDSDLYEENGNWAEQRKKLDTRREAAISEVFRQDGVEGVIRFADSVSSSRQVGHALGIITDDVFERTLLPHFLDSEDNKRKSFVSSFIWRRYHINGWEWCDNLDKSGWTQRQIGQFLACLPFTTETWSRASGWLKTNESEYWTRTDANAYHADGDLSIAIEKLIEHGRPHAAINCLDMMRHDNKAIDSNQCVRALLAALSSNEPSYAMDVYHIVELIKFLQTDLAVNQDDLFKVEWAYVPLLDRHTGAAPILLESRLANDPEFFCEVIRLIYRSKKEDQSSREPNEGAKALATNAWRLLNEWKTPPGTQRDGTFSERCFMEWLQKVKEISTNSGHLEVTLINVGEVLIHAPADPDGLWIRRVVAAALNEREVEEMRDGYRTGTYNSRGAHIIDPTASPERELAEQFRNKAEEIENAGFQRFAVTLKGLANSYDREADQILNDNNDRMDE
ncbi:MULTISPECIES: hypothetical protein [unclassified Arsukibacterium]|uniref:hypothetical protein n=1 Tax=unclassified Arsukibacterium TaxID=2635278 RepID=UPI000C47A335|nr:MULTISPECIES: hypothetical protein [unclassified Arsukibacterium]MAA96094.1 hypothetical protein [Rheinheimera sp.]MBM35442.1 hypothetical protein [Rheinheimera sp.]|tara:strand:- start:3130 stop:6669 length:3540 start_codon:yes stop_codon:yes gene_type:complete